MKKRALLCFSLVLVLIFSIGAGAKTTWPEPTSNFFVNDFAGVISSSDRAQMQQLGEQLYHACGAQVVVVTIQSLDGMDIADYSLRLARKWGIGDKDKDNGVLLLLSVGEPHVRIEVGNGLEGAIPDSKAGRLLDTYMIPNYTPSTFSVGLRDTYNAIVNEVRIECGIDPDADYTPIEEENESKDTGMLLIALGIFIFLIIITRGRILIWIFSSRGGGGFSGGGFGGGGFSGGGGGFSGGGASR